jgi:hypothetical protein
MVWDGASRADLLSEIAVLRLIVTLCTAALVFEHVADDDWIWAGLGAALAAGMGWHTVRAFRARKREVC